MARSAVIALAMVVALTLQGCGEECAEKTGNQNNCFEEHCGANAAKDKCLEDSAPDRDCCALQGKGSCAAGFTLTAKDSKICFSKEAYAEVGAPFLPNAYTTCCVPENAN